MGAGTKAAGVVIAGLFIVSFLNSNDQSDDEGSGELTGTAAAQTSEKKNESSSERVVAEPTPPRSPWLVRQTTSEIDDSPTVVLFVESDGVVRSRLGRTGRASLTLRCMENTTVMYFKFADNFMADINSYGKVTYRLDETEARSIRMKESTDNEAWGCGLVGVLSQ